jgi:hypothetical protein
MNPLSLRCAGPISLVTFAALSLALAACTSNVAIDGSGGGATTSTGTGGIIVDTGPSSGTGGIVNTAVTSTGAAPMTTGGGGGLPDGAIAIFDAQITQVPALQKAQWLDTGESLDPTTLIVMFGDHPESCGAPVFDYGSENHQFVLIGLPQAMQKVGKYNLSSTDIIAFGHSWFSDGMGNGGGGGGPINGGTVEVLSIDSSTITVRMEGLFADLAGQNGDHVATICPSGV